MQKRIRRTITKFIYLIVFFYVNIIASQSFTLEGKITDETGNPLEFVNVFAYPESNSAVVYTISDDVGRYKLNLLKNKSYKVTISYLGYISQTYNIILKSNKVKNIILKENSEKLAEVTLNYTPPVVVKKDTITYRADVFTTGKERKLRDILKKLPAVEVDRVGNITVQGKKVTKVLVENKEFFTGDSKLAVNNIPADAVDKIQVLDNYNEVGFLKDLEESEEVAMNIKLKEDKKNFAFGDVEAGAGMGVKERYIIHPSIYYYSPNTSINFIGDLNNTGTRSFTLKDYFEFEGGKDKLINDAKSYFSLSNDDIALFINRRNFTSSINQFGALSLNQALNKNIDLSGYGIFSKVKNHTEERTLIEYIGNNIIENRIETGNQNNTFGIGKINIRYNPNDYTDFKIASYIKASDNNAYNNLSSVTEQRRNIINTEVDVQNVSAKQELKWHKQFSENHTTSVVLNYHYQRATPNTNWLTNQRILQGLIPIIDEQTFNIFKRKKTEYHNVDFSLKHYWILNRFNHIYISFGSQLSFDDYKINEFQKLDDGTINDFSSANFNNDVNFNFSDIFFGVHYKLQKGKFIFKPGLFYHSYKWNINQFKNRKDNHKDILLPELSSYIEFTKTKKLNFKYNLRVRFPNISQLADRFTLLNFNSIYQGNQSLENELYHHYQLGFYSFNFFKDLFYSFTSSFKYKEYNFKKITTIQGIDLVSSPVLSNFEDKSLYFYGSIRKGFGKYRFSLKSSFSLVDYEAPINSEIVANKKNKFSFGGGMKTEFDNLPNIELNYTKSINKFKGLLDSEFQSDVFSFFLEYNFLKDFIFKFDYRFEKYNNKIFNITNTFDIANTSLFYQKESSPWGFEVSANNLFDVCFRQRNSFSTILVSDKQTFILPRITMFKITYKL